MENNKMTPPVDFQMGKVKIGGDAVKVEEPKIENKPPAYNFGDCGKVKTPVNKL